MTKETYYAVRIGDPKRRPAYFMLGADNATPALFTRKQEAKAFAPKQPETKIVKVTLHD